ncbi:MAG: VOC family protein [Ilumatobacteraceae bacterium]
MSAPTARLRLSHATVSVTDLDAMVAFYRDVLGFHVTNREALPDGSEAAFLSQDPAEHHQVLLICGPVGSHEFVMVDHLAFRTGTLDDLRSISDALAAAGVDGVIPISHGNAWSLYFNDPEGNGVECFVDSPFHVAQPYAGSLDLATDDAEIEATTRSAIEDLPEFQALADYQAAFESRLARGAAE